MNFAQQPSKLAVCLEKTAAKSSQISNYLCSFKVLRTIIVLFITICSLALLDPSHQSIRNLEATNHYRAEVSTIFYTLGNVQDLTKTLDSFMAVNTYPISKIIVAIDSCPSLQICDNLVKNNEGHHIKWVFNKGKERIGQLALLDLAYEVVESPFVFVSPSNQIYLKDGFIQQAIQLMQKQVNVSQVVIKNFDGSTSQSLTSLENVLAGFTFSAGLHRLANYKKIMRGYTGFSRNISYGKSAGRIEELISIFYYKQGLTIRQTGKKFIMQINNQLNPPPKYFLSPATLIDRWTNQDPNNCWLANKLFRAHRIIRAQKRQIRKQLSTVIRQNKVPIESLSLIEQLGFNQQIQIQTMFDYTKIASQQLLKNLTHYFPQTFPYDLKKYEGNKKPWIVKNLNQKYFKNVQQAKKYIQNLSINTKKQEVEPVSLYQKLAIALAQNPKDEKLLQSEYKIMKEKYGFDKVEKQLPICLFVEGFNGMTAGNLTKLFASLENQNYTNFQFVYVDDFSMDHTLKTLYNFLFTNFSRLLYKTKQIVFNQQILRTSGNLYLRAKQFCDGSQIIVNLNLNSSLIGTQFLNVINAIYQNKDIWVAMFPSIHKNIISQNKQNSQQNFIKQQYVKTKSISQTDNYRFSQYQIQGYLKTYRYFLVHKIPLQHLIELSYNQQIDGFAPRFYKTSSDSFYFYSLLEMSSNKIKIVDQIYMDYNPHHILTECHMEKQKYEQLKARLKFPLKPIQSTNHTVIIDRSQNTSQNFINQLKERNLDLQICMAPKNQTPIEPPNTKFSQFLQKAKQKLVFPNQYITPMPSQPYQQLPFCIIIRDDLLSKNELLKQTLKQNYTNFKIIKIRDEPQETINLNNNVIQINTKDHSYYNYLRVIQKNCGQFPIVLFVDHNLKEGILKKINKLYQTKNIWMTYSETPNYFVVSSFYWRMYELVNLTDFQGFNRKYLQQEDFQFQALSLLQIGAKHSLKMRIQQVYDSQYIQYDEKLESTSEINPAFSLFTAYKTYNRLYARDAYQYLLQLASDTPVNSSELQRNIQKVFQGQQYSYKPFANSQLSKHDLLRSIQYRQLQFLPRNHILNRREFEEVSAKFNVDKYMDNQLRFCLVVSGRNNTQNNRHYKNLKTIFEQEYDNLYVVYIDDVSDDATMSEAMQFTRQQKFPKEKIVFVQNINRKFASYNTVNAAFNFCGEDDIQVKFDADDELVGRHAISVLNAVYQQHPQYFLVYTNLVTGLYAYGLSMPALSKQDYLNCDGTRRKVHFIAPLKAWRVKMIRSLPIIYHQLEDGGWLDTLEDDALQASFLELATIKRIKYVPWINYYRNVHYGSNDDSNREKLQHRSEVFDYVIQLPELQPLNDINERYKNTPMIERMKSDYGKEFKVFDL